MKWILTFASILIATLLIFSGASSAQQYSNLYGGMYGEDNAPTAQTPKSAEALGLQPPTTTSGQTTSPLSDQSTLMMSDETAAKSGAPRMMSTGSQSAYFQIITPPTGFVSNKFYVPYSPQTVASCNLNNYLPLWLNVAKSGTIWGYEWYPSGRIDVQYLGSVFPGWYQRGFYADTPGWHILQYYCSGWSNYIYIYVYGSSYYPQTTGQAKITIQSNWMKGYSVYVDGNYVGKDGQGSDYTDGIYSFYVTGNQYHFIKVNYMGHIYNEQGTFRSGYTYRMSI